MKMQTISVPVEPKYLKKIREMEKEKNLDRNSVMRVVVDKGMKEVLLEEAVTKYINGEVSMWRASEIAGISLRKMMEVLNSKGIELNYSVESAMEDLK
jgi:predicted HTH domain antitoxin